MIGGRKRRFALKIALLWSLLLWSLLLWSLLLFLPGCAQETKPDPFAATGGPAVTISPGSGVLKPGTSITLSSAAGATIYYTLDESLPTRDSLRYDRSFALWSSTGVTAVAYDKEGKRGPAILARYLVDSLFPHVQAIPTGSTLTTPIQVTLRSDEKSVIYFTIDGARPTTKSARYTGPIDIKADTDLQFFAVDDTGNASPVFREVYAFPPSVSVTPAAGLLRDNKVLLSLKASKPAIVEFQLAQLQSNAWFRYQSPFQLSDDVALNVRATSDPGGRSTVQRFNYALLSPFRWRTVLTPLSDVQAVLTVDLEGLDRPRTLLVRPDGLDRLKAVGEKGWGLDRLKSWNRKVRWTRSWDVDGDGLQDVLLGQQDGTVALLQALSVDSLQVESTLLPALSKGSYRGVTPLDYDGDGQLDLLLLGTRTTDSQLWRRTGNRFVQVKPLPFPLPEGTLATLAGDWDSDQRQDLLVLPGGTAWPLLLYRNQDRSLQKRELDVLSGIDGDKLRWSLAVRVDLDSDNRLDLMLLGRRPSGVWVWAAVRQVGQRFWKLRGFGELGKGDVRDAVPFDLDQDGFPDLVITRRDGPPWMLKNFQGERWYKTSEPQRKDPQGWGGVSLGELFGGLRALFFFGGSQPSLADWKARGRFLRVVVQGIRGNRSAIGAQVQLRVGTRIFLREVGPASTGADQHELLLPIGLGSTGSIGPMVIRWPDGQKREIPEPPLGRTLIVTRQP